MTIKTSTYIDKGRKVLQKLSVNKTSLAFEGLRRRLLDKSNLPIRMINDENQAVIYKSFNGDPLAKIECVDGKYNLAPVNGDISDAMYIELKILIQDLSRQLIDEEKIQRFTNES